jgi:hypothetical protein
VDDVEALSTILGVLKQLDPLVQSRVLHSVETFLGVVSPQKVNVQPLADLPPSRTPGQDFSRDRVVSPKEFMRDKNPTTDVERVACLSYYLTHYRDTPHFKTLDISTLNTEAAQPKFSNTSVAVDNARSLGYLAPATSGNKQLSAAGERFVELLPDRDAAREAMQRFRPRRGKRTKMNKDDRE